MVKVIKVISEGPMGPKGDAGDSNFLSISSSLSNRITAFENNTVLSSSAQIANNISGAITSFSASDSSRVTVVESYVLGKEVLSSSAQIATNISGAFVLTSGSLASRIYNIETTRGIAVACSDEISQLTATASIANFMLPFNMSLTEILASVRYAPSGSNLIVDVNREGLSVISGSVKLVIEKGEFSSLTSITGSTIASSSLYKGEMITVDTDQVGSLYGGAGLKIYLIGN